MYNKPLDNIDDYPSPVRLSYQALQHESGPAYVNLRRLLDCFECLVKFLSVSAMQSLMSSPEARERITPGLTGKLIKPPLGIWTGLLDHLAKEIADQGNCFFEELATFHGGKQTSGLPLLREKVEIPEIRSTPFDFRNVKPALQEFVNIRNWYAHSPVPETAICEEHLRILAKIYNKLLYQASFLKNYRISEPSGDYKIYLEKEDGGSCCLSPMLIQHNSEHLFFRDAQLYRKGKLTYQSYVNIHTLVTNLTFNEFKMFYALVRADGKMHLAHRSPPASEVFGRENDLARLLQRLNEGISKRLLITGFPGIGKSAFSTYVRENISTDEYICINLHFDANDQQTLRLEFMYREIMAGLQKNKLIRPTYPADYTPHEVKLKLAEILNQAVSRLSLNRKILLIIDGLDEAVNHGSGDCLEVIPEEPPDNCLIVMLSRPVEQVRRWWLKEHEMGNFPIELGPLKENAVRNLLEEAIPWPVLHRDRNIVYRAINASYGHPLYLKHLIEDILEGKEDPELKGLPAGMEAFYLKIFNRLSSTSLALDMACVLAVSAEPLNRDELAVILGHDPEIQKHKLDVALEALLEVLHEFSCEDRGTAYHFFHLSVSEYVLKVYPHRVKKAEKLILAWQCPGSSELLENLDNLRSGRMLKATCNSLVPSAMNRIASREILTQYFVSLDHQHQALQTLFHLAERQKKPVFKTFAVDILKRLLSSQPEAFSQKLTELILIRPDDIELYRLAIEAMIKKSLEFRTKSELIRMVGFRLFQGKKNETFHLLINATASLARYPEGFPVFLEIIWSILPFQEIRGADEAELLACLSKELGSDGSGLEFMQRFRETDRSFKILKGGEKPVRLTCRFALIFMISPRLWIPAATMAAKGISLCVKYRQDLIPALRSGLICADLLLQAVPLIFTLRDRPALTAEGVKNIIAMEKFIRNIVHRLSLPQAPNLIDLLEKEIRSSQENVFTTGLLFFSVVTFLRPHLRDMFNYSSPGLEAVINYNKEDVELVRESLPLLLQNTPITSTYENNLTQMLQKEDAFNNYFAMVSIIIHSERNFLVCRRILNRMLEPHPSGSKVRSQVKARQRLKIYRQAISIFSYIFRRIEDNIKLADRASDYLFSLNNSLLQELDDDRKMRNLFSCYTIFGQEDPFNPLLPMGIYCSGRLVSPEREQIYNNNLHKWLEYAKKWDLEENKKITYFKRVVFELVPLSYFSPEFAVEQSLILYQKYRDTNEREAIRDVMGTINHMVPGITERVYFHLQSYKSMDLELETIIYEIMSFRIEENQLKNLFKSMRVFAWHECITTVMVSHPKLSQRIIDGFEQSFQPGQSMYHLTTSLAESLAEFFYSPEINGDFFKVFGIEKNESPGS